jgi:hypothetical protein
MNLGLRFLPYNWSFSVSETSWVVRLPRAIFLQFGLRKHWIVPSALLNLVSISYFSLTVRVSKVELTKTFCSYKCFHLHAPWKIGRGGKNSDWHTLKLVGYS